MRTWVMKEVLKCCLGNLKIKYSWSESTRSWVLEFKGKKDGLWDSEKWFGGILNDQK